MVEQIKQLPEPAGIRKELFLDGKNRMVDVFMMYEGNISVQYAYIQKPHTDFGISASIRRMK